MSGTLWSLSPIGARCVRLVVRHLPATIEGVWTVAYEAGLVWPDAARGGNGFVKHGHTHWPDGGIRHHQLAVSGANRRPSA
jgi:hypothetical protein